MILPLYSQNHLMTEVGRDLQRSSGPSLPLQQGHLEPVLLPRAMSRHLLTISKHGDSTSFLDNLCQCSLTHTLKKGFLTFRGIP